MTNKATDSRKLTRLRLGILGCVITMLLMLKRDGRLRFLIMNSLLVLYVLFLNALLLAFMFAGWGLVVSIGRGG